MCRWKAEIWNLSKFWRVDEWRVPLQLHSKLKFHFEVASFALLSHYHILVFWMKQHPLKFWDITQFKVSAVGFFFFFDILVKENNLKHWFAYLCMYTGDVIRDRAYVNFLAFLWKEVNSCAEKKRMESNDESAEEEFGTRKHAHIRRMLIKFVWHIAIRTLINYDLLFYFGGGNKLNLLFSNKCWKNKAKEAGKKEGRNRG